MMNTILTKNSENGSGKGKRQRNLIGEEEKSHLEPKPLSLTCATEGPYAATRRGDSSTNLRIM
jgi:hypothetical protein